MPILVLGIGNLVMSDDGAGVRVIQHLAENYAFPDEVRLLDGGTLGLDLLPQLEGVERLIVVDAVDVAKAPGTVVRLCGDEVPIAMETRLSPHQMGLKDLLAVATLQGVAPAEMVLLGVQPEKIELGLELSDVVEESIGQLAGKVLGQLREWGLIIPLHSPYSSCYIPSS